MNYMEKIGNDTDITPPQDYTLNLLGQGVVITLIRKHGTGISWTNWGCNHGNF